MIDKERHRLPERDRGYSERDAEWLFQHLKVASSIKWDEDVAKECNELYKEANVRESGDPPLPSSSDTAKYLNKKYASRGHVYTQEQVRDFLFALVCGRGADLQATVKKNLDLEIGESTGTSEDKLLKEEKAYGYFDCFK